MKKLTKLMAILMALCLITSSFVGSTLAKYVTQADANDTARVAKFGVVLQADGNLFGKNYVDAISLSDDEAELAVQSSLGDDVVAPGTNNATGLNFSINGIPEVSTRLDATIEYENIYLSAGNYAVMVAAPNVTADSFKADTYYTKTGDTYAPAATWADATEYYTMTDEVSVAATYYPVVFTADVTGTTAEDTIKKIGDDYAAKLGTVTSTSVADGKTTVVLSDEYDPNFNYATLNVAGDNLTWAWAYELTSGTDEEKANVDGKDTILGQLIAQKKGDLATAKGEVIDTDTMEAPVEAAGTDANDFNLDAAFSINLKVTQLDVAAQ